MIFKGFRITKSKLIKNKNKNQEKYLLLKLNKLLYICVKHNHFLNLFNLIIVIDISMKIVLLELKYPRVNLN